MTFMTLDDRVDCLSCKSTLKARIGVEAFFASRRLSDIWGHTWLDLDDHLWRVVFTAHAIFLPALRTAKDIKKSFVLCGLLCVPHGRLFRSLNPLGVFICELGNSDVLMPHLLISKLLPSSIVFRVFVSCGLLHDCISRWQVAIDCISIVAKGHLRWFLDCR